MDTAVDPDFVSRFLAAFSRLSSGGRVGLAVSGGPDSMAMLLLAAASIDDFEVASVNHGLRPEAVDECALVTRACEELGVAYTLLEVQLGKGNLQEEARHARYAALGKWARDHGLSAILTAHHADDQAETFMMRLNRGSGLSGLAGVREIGRVDGCEVPILRPLLDFRRMELQSIVAASGLEVAQDPSNRDERFDRVRIRNALADTDWLDAASVAHSAQLLSQAEDYLSDVLAALWNTHVAERDSGISYFPGPSKFANVEMLVRIFAHLGEHPSRGDVARLSDRLWQGESGNLSGILARPVKDMDGPGIDNRRWDFAPEPPRRTA